jgi:hypothetical protein
MSYAVPARPDVVITQTSRSFERMLTSPMSNVHAVSFSGELDVSAKPLIDRALERIEHFGRQSVAIVALMKMTYLDSTLLIALARVPK